MDMTAIIMINSLAPGRNGTTFKGMIFKLVTVYGIVELGLLRYCCQMNAVFEISR